MIRFTLVSSISLLQTGPALLAFLICKWSHLLNRFLKKRAWCNSDIYLYAIVHLRECTQNFFEIFTFNLEELFWAALCTLLQWNFDFQQLFFRIVQIGARSGSTFIESKRFDLSIFIPMVTSVSLGSVFESEQWIERFAVVSCMYYRCDHSLPPENYQYIQNVLL